MAENIYFNCNLFMELLDCHNELQKKFARTNEEVFHEMASSFAEATHQLASSPLTADSAQALMMCWNAIRTFRQEQQLLVDCADRIVAYLAQMKPAAPQQPVQEAKPKRAAAGGGSRGGKGEKAKRSYAPRGAAKKQQQQQQQQPMPEALLKETEEEKRAKDDFQRIVESLLQPLPPSPPPPPSGGNEQEPEAVPASQVNSVFDPDRDGTQVPDW
jgi:hypothetical protein